MSRRAMDGPHGMAQSSDSTRRGYGHHDFTGGRHERRPRQGSILPRDIRLGQAHLAGADPRRNARAGPSTRVGITRRLGWSAPGVTRPTTELRDRGLLRQLSDGGRGERGCSSRHLALAPGRVLGLGVALASDAMRWTPLDTSGTRLEDGGQAMAGSSQTRRRSRSCVSRGSSGAVRGKPSARSR